MATAGEDLLLSFGTPPHHHTYGEHLLLSFDTPPPAPQKCGHVKHQCPIDERSQSPAVDLLTGSPFEATLFASPLAPSSNPSGCSASTSPCQRFCAKRALLRAVESYLDTELASMSRALRARLDLPPINTPRRIAAEDPFVDSRSPAQNQGDEAGPGGDEGPNETDPEPSPADGHGHRSEDEASEESH